VIKFLKFIFHVSVILLIIISLYPGSLLGYLFYGDSSQQPNLIQNPFGTSINHFFYYFYVTILGLFVYLRTNSFKKLIYILFFLSIILEVLQFIVPNRVFQLYDLTGNLLGVLVAYFLIKIYLYFIKHE
jgi:VanZ family protein